jgi:3-oxoacyl-[acyl-carrier-protein] synthase II
MKIFIRASACISPQQTFGDEGFLSGLTEYRTNRLNVIEPDYKSWTDARQLRRMSRILKMGVTTAMACLKKGNLEMPDAIITATAYGCLEDTTAFLTEMVERHEQSLSPTAFIQSTHNTVGAQIALRLKCHAYNNTFVHGGFSFESALLDAMMLLKEGEANKILVGSADELTDTSFAILSRFGLYKPKYTSNIELYTAKTKGTLAGEGAAFFLLSKDISDDNIAEIEGLETYFGELNFAESKEFLARFLDNIGISIDDVDLVITGASGDVQNDALFTELQGSILKHQHLINYKHLCGEYPTAVSFALSLATEVVTTGKLPQALVAGGPFVQEKIERVLIFNRYQTEYHSLVMIKAMDQ